LSCLVITEVSSTSRLSEVRASQPDRQNHRR